MFVRLSGSSWRCCFLVLGWFCCLLRVSEARGTGGVDSASTGGTWDISNADRIGKGEVQLCNTLIEGAAKLVKWENMMETGQRSAAEKAIFEIIGPQYPPHGLSGASQERVGRVCVCA